MNLLTVDQILQYNREISDRYSLEHGVINPNILTSICEIPIRVFFGKEMFPSIYEKSASILESLIRFHPFLDGNKRTALESVCGFLFLNDYIFLLPLETPRFLVKIAQNPGQSEKENSALIKKISKWVSKYSAKMDDKERIVKVLMSHYRKLKFWFGLSRVPILRYVAGIYFYSRLQLKVYENTEIMEYGISNFIEHMMANTNRMVEKVKSNYKA